MKRVLKIILLLCYFSHLYAQETVNVGIYQNKPKIFMDKNNLPKGFYVDILNEIALKKNLQLNYVPCDWSECLKQLTQNKIDIMPDVAYTLEREKDFLFSNEPVLSSWSLLYKHRDIKIEHIFDLKNKKIAVMKNSIQADKIKDILYKFGVENSFLIEVDSFSEAFELVKNRKADCALSNRFYELNNTLYSDIVKTNILVEPSVLKFAFSKNSHYLINIIDNGLIELKKDKKSIFYTAKKDWITPKQEQKIPKWVVWSSVVSIGVILVLIFLVYLFRKMVEIKSQELLKKEQIILLQAKHATMGEMIEIIAHQWKQPLSTLSMAANNIKLSIGLQEEIGIKEIDSFAESVLHHVQHLSSTIDDFRNFFRSDKTITSANTSEILHSLMKIIGKSLENNNIKVVVECKEEFTIDSYHNELLHVLLNIINNAKYALIENQISKPKITIKIFKQNANSIIKIIDNAGGIPAKVIENLGKKYFTTKGNQGTGLGIYMSKIIVEEHLKGSLNWENNDQGACFTIFLP